MDPQADAGAAVLSSLKRKSPEVVRTEERANKFSSKRVIVEKEPRSSSLTVNVEDKLSSLQDKLESTSQQTKALMPLLGLLGKIPQNQEKKSSHPHTLFDFILEIHRNLTKVKALVEQNTEDIESFKAQWFESNTGGSSNDNSDTNKSSKQTRGNEARPSYSELIEGFLDTLEKEHYIAITSSPSKGAKNEMSGKPKYLILPSDSVALQLVFTVLTVSAWGFFAMAASASILGRLDRDNLKVVSKSIEEIVELVSVSDKKEWPKNWKPRNYISLFKKYKESFPPGKSRDDPAEFVLFSFLFPTLSLVGGWYNLSHDHNQKQRMFMVDAFCRSSIRSSDEDRENHTGMEEAMREFCAHNPVIDYSEEGNDDQSIFDFLVQKFFPSLRALKSSSVLWNDVEDRIIKFLENDFESLPRPRRNLTLDEDFSGDNLNYEEEGRKMMEANDGAVLKAWTHLATLYLNKSDKIDAFLWGSTCLQLHVHLYNFICFACHKSKGPETAKKKNILFGAVTHEKLNEALKEASRPSTTPERHREVFLMFLLHLPLSMKVLGTEKMSFASAELGFQELPASQHSEKESFEDIKLKQTRFPPMATTAVDLSSRHEHDNASVLSEKEGTGFKKKSYNVCGDVVNFERKSMTGFIDRTRKELRKLNLNKDSQLSQLATCNDNSCDLKEYKSTCILHRGILSRLVKKTDEIHKAFKNCQVSPSEYPFRCNPSADAGLCMAEACSAKSYDNTRLCILHMADSMKDRQVNRLQVHCANCGRAACHPSLGWCLHRIIYSGVNIRSEYKKDLEKKFYFMKGSVLRALGKLDPRELDPREKSRIVERLQKGKAIASE